MFEMFRRMYIPLGQIFLKKKKGRKKRKKTLNLKGCEEKNFKDKYEIYTWGVNLSL